MRENNKKVIYQNPNNKNEFAKTNYDQEKRNMSTIRH